MTLVGDRCALQQEQMLLSCGMHRADKYQRMQRHSVGFSGAPLQRMQYRSGMTQIFQSCSEQTRSVRTYVWASTVVVKVHAWSRPPCLFACQMFHGGISSATKTTFQSPVSWRTRSCSYGMRRFARVRKRRGTSLLCFSRESSNVKCALSSMRPSLPRAASSTFTKLMSYLRQARSHPWLPLFCFARYSCHILDAKPNLVSPLVNARQRCRPTTVVQQVYRLGFLYGSFSLARSLALSLSLYLSLSLSLSLSVRKAI